MCITVVFASIYFRQIFLGGTLFYKDIGSDTINLYYPQALLGEKIGCAPSGYVLREGFGAFRVSNWVRALNPLNWILIICGKHFYNWGELVTWYIEYILVGVFAYQTMRLQDYSEEVSGLASLIWTFCGYFVLWGQQNYLSAMCWFTIALFFLNKCFQQKRYTIPFVYSLFCLGLINYYFIYMMGVFFIVYVIIYCLKNNYTLKQIGHKLVWLAMCGILSISMAAIVIFPSLRQLFESTRVATDEQKIQSLFYGIKYIISSLGRLVSNDVFGIGDGYSGYYNYYEVICLATSVLVIFAIVAYGKKNGMTKTLGLVVCVGLLIAMPVVTKFMTLDARKPRWSFMLVFLFVGLIAYALNEIQQKKVTLDLRDCGIVVAIYMVIVLILMVADRKQIVGVNKKIILLVFAFLVVYAIMFILKARMNWLLLVVCVEMIVMNYPAVNFRKTISVEDWNNGYYADGTTDAIEIIESGDSGLYRVNKSYFSCFLNDGMAEGYNGMSIYASTNSKVMIDAIESFDLPLIFGKTNCISIPYERGILNSLFGVKYMIAKTGDWIPDNYERIDEINGLSIYKNVNETRFGLLYGSQVAKSEYDSLAGMEKDACLTSMYYYTDGNSEGNIDEISLDEIKSTDAYEYIAGYEYGTGTFEDGALKISSDESEMHMYMTMPKVDYPIVQLKISVSESIDVGIICENGVLPGFYAEKSGYYIVDLSKYQNISGICVVLRGDLTNVDITDMKYEGYDMAQIEANIQDLSENIADNVSYSGSEFIYEIENVYSKDAMFCAPIFYDSYWHAYVNGKEVPVYNINGGLVGVKDLDNGHNKLQLVYENKAAAIGKYVSLFSMIMYVALMVLDVWKNSQSRK
ncbi:MAG: YfhO family protein [Lachnospiraceae bacterium]|nr:YfhO family protein [Lachnospiraceae bacterium]